MTTETTLDFTDTETTAQMGSRFQKTAISVACVALSLMVFQSDAGIGAIAKVATGYGIGIALFVAILLLIQFLWHRMRERQSAAEQTDPMAWYRAYIKRVRWGDITIALLTLMVTMSCFTIYKGTVVGSDGYGYDAAFTAWDRIIFADNDPWALTHAILPTAFATKVIDFLYHPAFFPMVIGYLLCFVAHGKPTLRYTYMTAYLASVVIIGMISANALHSAGPVYDGALFGDGTTFGPLIERLAAQNKEAGPFSAVFAQGYLLRLNEMDLAGLGGGISAMPSMHIVFAFLWAFAAFHLHRILGVVVAFYALIIWLGSVHLGWHYFVDGLVGLLLLAVIWYAAGRGFGLYGRA